ncbi:hypothetical protein ZIOFF_018275 [Zingiber officinale]|uniref:Uncharacterized protein n=1 Tax=Zingiber officinale TaxID=94328 RepID=A0A8J5H805_ZINOF|nr:hypothetical protein ZIOFF_018275 [Zingiber officinale]
MLSEMELPEEFDVVSVDLEETDSDAICNISEGEHDTEQYCSTVTSSTPEFLFVLIGETQGWQVQADIPEIQFSYTLSRLIAGQEPIAVLTEGSTSVDAVEEASASSRFPLLTRYEDLIHDTLPKILSTKEHEKRHQMAKIEDKAIDNMLESLRELELIIQMKEYDFLRRRQAEGGNESYWHRNLDTVHESRKDLFTEGQHIMQLGKEIRSAPP